MPCSVTRGLGLRAISDLDGLVFYIQARTRAKPPAEWAALKTGLQAVLTREGIHSGGDYDPVSELTLVRVDREGRIAGHLFLKDGRRMPKAQDEPISTLVLFRTDWRGRLVEMENNTHCCKPGPVLSGYDKSRGLSKCEARLRLAYLLGALREADLLEALAFDTPDDEVRMAHLCNLRQRMRNFLATRPAFSSAAEGFVRRLHDVLVAEDPAAAFNQFAGEQAPAVLRRILCELLQLRIVKVDATGTGILPLWHQKQTLLVDDERKGIFLHLPAAVVPGGSRGVLARAEALAWRLDRKHLTGAPQARGILAQPELEVDPFLRDAAVKYLGARMCAPDLPLLIGVLGDQYDVAAGSAITLLAGADAPELRQHLCRAIDQQRDREVFCTNAISVLGKRHYPDARECATVATYLEGVISEARNRANGGLRICYSGILALKRLSQQEPAARDSILEYVVTLAAEPRTPKILSGLIRHLFPAETA